MILFALALAAVQPAAQPVFVPPPPPPAAAPDSARVAAAQRLLETMHIEQQYDQILSKMIPLMTVQIFGSLKDNVKVSPHLRTFLADETNAATANRMFADEAATAFKAHYPQMRNATAQEYARVFSAAELTGLADFYATPLGQKALNNLPELQTRLIPVGMAAGSEAGREAMMRVIVRLGLDRELAPKS